MRLSSFSYLPTTRLYNNWSPCATLSVRNSYTPSTSTGETTRARVNEWVSARERKIAGNDNAIRVHKVSKIRMKTATTTTTTTFSVLVTKQKQQRRSRNNNIIGLCLHRRTSIQLIPPPPPPPPTAPARSHEWMDGATCTIHKTTLSHPQSPLYPSSSPARSRPTKTTRNNSRRVVVGNCGY